jgi:hypothetical protein
MKFGTHNSITGERPLNLLAKALRPFSQCQSKTIRGQVEADCRFFDIRLVLSNGKFLGAHGLAVFDYSFAQFLTEIQDRKEILFRVVHEDTFCDDGLSFEEFVTQVVETVKQFSCENQLISISRKSDWSKTITYIHMRGYTPIQTNIHDKKLYFDHIRNAPKTYGINELYVEGGYPVYGICIPLIQMWRDEARKLIEECQKDSEAINVIDFL